MWYYPKKHLFQDNSNSYDMFHYDSWISECQLLSSYYLHEFIICRIKSTAIVDCKTIRGGWKFKEAVNIFVGLILAYSRKSPLYIFLNRNWVYLIFFRKNFVLVLFKCAKPGRIIRTLITQRFRDFEILRVNGGRERGGGVENERGKKKIWANVWMHQFNCSRKSIFHQASFRRCSVLHDSLFYILKNTPMLRISIYVRFCQISSVFISISTKCTRFT